LTLGFGGDVIGHGAPTAFAEQEVLPCPCWNLPVPWWWRSMGWPVWTIWRRLQLHSLAALRVGWSVTRSRV
jgi:hypothetical protein